MNNTYYVLSMDWMHSHKLQITFYMNLHIIGKSTNVLCPQSSVALRYTQLLPAIAVLLMTSRNHFASKNFPIIFMAPTFLVVSINNEHNMYVVYIIWMSCAYHVHVMCISCACDVHIMYMSCAYRAYQFIDIGGWLVKYTLYAMYWGVSPLHC